MSRRMLINPEASTPATGGFSPKDSSSHVYANIQLTTAGAYPGSLTPATFYETRTTPVITDPSKYNLSVVRFEMDTSTIPLLYVAPGAANELPYSIGVQVGGMGGSWYYQNLVWTPEDLTAKPGTDAYNALYSIEHFVRIMNTALNALSHTAGITNTFTTTYDPSSQRIILSGNEDTLSNALFLNENLWMLIPNLDASRSAFVTGGGTPSTSDVWYQLNWTLKPALGAYICEQEFPNLQGFNSLVNITLTTRGIPIQSEAVSIPSGTGAYTTGKGDGTALILTDFMPTTSVGFESTRQRFVYYVPSSEYRLIELMSNSPLKVIDLQIYWTDLNGTLRPLMLRPNTFCSVKLLFRRKDFASYS